MLHTIDLVLPVENAIPPEICQSLIKKFNRSEDRVVHDCERYKFEELNLNKTDGFSAELYLLTETNNRLLQFYARETGAKHLPANFLFEEFRMKKYEPDSGEFFDWHVDVGNHDTAKRFLAFIYYVNTVEEGGETVFDWNCDDEKGFSVMPIEGSVAVFPPLWMYPHIGTPPISGSKYIISTYAHYI
tara:strand:- start:750 stop:1310 length:561 start_codon:yes stop_codon:yes gene_type:complete